jgi:broad specificity phosphatase PhoE
VEKNMSHPIYHDLDPGRTHVLLFRHAEREEIIQFHKSTEALLTARGKADARRLGGELAGRFDKKTIFHSPVRRCAQTAAELARGLADKNDPAVAGGELSWLAGDFIGAQADFVNDYMNVHGWQAFLRTWFDGVFPAERIQPLTVAAPTELTYLKKQLAAHAGLVIDVSHDWNMMILLEHYFALRFESAGVPGFLEYIAVSAAPSGRLRLAYRGRTVETGV